MDLALFLPIALTAGGGAFLYRNVALLNDDAKLERFLTHSKRGKQEVLKHGKEVAKERLKLGYIKVGIGVSTALLVAGLLNLAAVAPNFLA